MNRQTYIGFAKIDIKNIFRDKSLVMMLFLPLLFVFLLQVALPAIAEYFNDIMDYQGLIVVFFGIIAAFFPAYVVSFVMLDEKDQDLQTVLKVMPLPYHLFVIYRIVFTASMAFISCFVTMFFSGFSIVWYKTVLISAQTSLIAPTAVLFVVCNARNKIEGVALFKLLNVFVFLPVLSYFVDAWYRYLFAIHLLFWPFELTLNSNLAYPVVEIAGSFVIGIIYLLIAYHFFFNSKRASR